MIGAWTINVSGRVYGPFTADRMRGFVNEGRLAPHSLVAREGSADWHEAREEPEFTDVFSHRSGQQPAPAAAKIPTPVPAPQPAYTAPTPTPHPAQATAVATIGRGEAAEATRTAHFAVIVDEKSQSTTNLEEAIHTLGPAHRLTSNVWIISTEQSVSAVRNRLVQELGKSDSLFVIDASRGKAAWFNFGPEADVRIRRVWQKT